MSIKTKLIQGLLIALASLLALLGAYFYGRSDERAHCNTVALTSELKGVQDYEEMERSVKRMDVSTLDDVLDYWMQ